MMVSLLDDILDLMRQGETGHYKLEFEGSEINLFLEQGLLVHAQYKWIFGLEALLMALSWEGATADFIAGVVSPVHFLKIGADELGQHIEESRKIKRFAFPDDLSKAYFCASMLPQGVQVLASDKTVYALCEARTLSEIARAADMNHNQIEATLKYLLSQEWVYVDENPAHPDRLKRVLPSVRPQPPANIFGFFKKSKIQSLSELERSVFDLLNGGISLWDIVKQLGLSSQQVWWKV
jgi:hypothetical protein